MNRTILVGVVLLCSTPTAFGGGWAQSAGYVCHRAQQGSFGLLSTDTYIDDDGSYHISKEVAGSSGTWEIALNRIEGVHAQNAEITAYFERRDADFSKPLEFARLSVSFPRPQKPTHMYITLNTGEHLSQPSSSRDRSFFAAFLRAASFAVDVIDYDGITVSHTVYEAKDFVSVIPSLNRLDRETTSAIKNYQSACEKLRLEVDIF